jgi:hypothetical protein
MRPLFVWAMLSLGLALTACVGRMSDTEVKVDTWYSPQGTVQLDYLLGHDVGCKAVTAWLDSIKIAYREEDPQALCKVHLIYQDQDFLTYCINVQNLPTEYYEGDTSYRVLTFVRKDGHVLSAAELTDDMDALGQKILSHTRLENAWVLDAVGGEEEFFAQTGNFSVGVTARGLTVCYSVVEGMWQLVCTIPSSEMKMK